MIRALLSFVAGLLGKMLGGFFGHTAPTPVDLADSNARAREQLHQEEASNAILTKAIDVRTDADARVVRAVTGAPGDANAALKEQFPDAFRD